MAKTILLKNYKKRLSLLILLSIVLLSLLFITGCNNPQQEQPQENYYTVTYLAEEGGAIDGMAEQSVKEGEDAEAVTAVPDEGYIFSKWSDGVTTATRQDSNVTSEITATAEFEKIPYTVQYLAGEGGTISGNTNQQVKHGESATAVGAVPDEGYIFSKWSDGVTTATRQETNVTSEITVTAEFEKITYTVQYLAGEGGTISGNTIQQVKYGENTTEVEAIPDEGYYFVKWSDGVVTATRQETNVTSAITVTAEFEKITYTVQYLAGEGGTISGNTNQQVKHGESATAVGAVPDEGYYFVKWSDGATTAARQDANVTSAITVTAEFEKLTYAVQYLAEAGGTIIGNMYQRIAFGENAKEVTAVPDEGYYFVKWSDGVTTATRQETNVTSATTITAEFSYKEEFAGGIGTQYDPYLIENYEQFRNIRNYPTAYYKLISDLDLNGIIYEPYFTDMYRFEGMFDGNGKIIKNFNINSDNNFPSLFGFIGAGGIVKNLNIENADITAINFNTLKYNVPYCVGILAGVSYGNLDSIIVNGTLHGDAFNYDQITIGGLVGMAYGDIKSCIANVDIDVSGIERLNSTGTTLPFVFGGLIGVYNSSGTSLTDSCSYGNITVSSIESEDTVLVGGLVGYYFTKQTAISIISECQTDITINGNRGNAGGFIGTVDVKLDSSLYISNCSAHGSISNVSDAGGFMYEANGSSKCDLIIENCFTDNGIDNVYHASGFAVNLNGSNLKAMQIINCNTRGDISSIATGMPSGFSHSANYIDFAKCYTFGTVSGYYANGFGSRMMNCNFVECFTSGDIYTKSGSGFIYSLTYGSMINCYSSSNLIYNLTASASKVIAGVGGFIYGVANSEIRNCYYSGVISLNDNSVEYKINNNAGTFIGISRSTDIINCHVLRNNIIPALIGQIQIVNDYEYYHDLNFYDNPEDMYLLAEKLNEGNDEGVWENVESSFPHLSYEGNNKNL